MQRLCSLFYQSYTLAKKSFLSLKKNDHHFDYDGKEFEAVLQLDSNFFIEYLELKVVDMDYLSFRFEHFRLECIWSLPNYKEIIDKALDIIITKAPVFSNWEHPSAVLFTFEEKNDNTIEKAHKYLADFIETHFKDQQRIMMIMSVVLYRFRDKFISYLKQFLLKNKDLDIFKNIWLETSGVITGSRVPYIQKEIDFCGEITRMVKGLPNILDYADHIKYLEQKIIRLKKNIENEQKRYFEGYID